MNGWPLTKGSAASSCSSIDRLPFGREILSRGPCEPTRLVAFEQAALAERVSKAAPTGFVCEALAKSALPAYVVDGH